MVIVTIGRSGLNFIRLILLQQILQSRKRRTFIVLAVTAIFDIQVLSAFDAQAFALGVVKWIDRHLEEGVFAQHWSEVNLHVVGEHQPGLADRIFVESE